jgi:hypothetical protein
MSKVDFIFLLLQEQEEMRGAAASTHADATKDPSSAPLISYRRLRGHWMPSYQR